MRGWYTMHDLTKMRIGFHSIDTTKKPIPKKAERLPTKSLPNVEVIISSRPPFKSYNTSSDKIFGVNITALSILISILVVICFPLVIVITFYLCKFMTRASTKKDRDRVRTPYQNGPQETATLVIL